MLALGGGFKVFKLNTFIWPLTIYDYFRLSGCLMKFVVSNVEILSTIF